MKFVTLLLTAALVAAGTACAATGRTASVPGAGRGPIAAATFDDGLVPSQVGGLRTSPEDVEDLLADVGDESYATVIGMWSLREEERLRATMQVTRLAPDARVEDEDFRARLAGQIGSSEIRPRLVDDDVVYVAVSNRQPIYVWFVGLHVLVLTVAEDYPAPRGLLRDALTEVRP